MSDPVTPAVSVVVVSYQTRELILTALATLRIACPGGSYEVIVVDNASTDGSAAAVAATVPEARVIRLARNVGFGRAVNVGAAQARADWLLLLNPDTEPVGDVIGELLAFTRAHPGHGIYAGRTLHPDGTDDGRSVFGTPSLWASFCFATPASPRPFPGPGSATRRPCPGWTARRRPGYRPPRAACCWSGGHSSPSSAASPRTTSCTARTWISACVRPRSAPARCWCRPRGCCTWAVPRPPAPGSG
ncbi:glycosyltransferase [Plantactinospora sp. CA-290183]|uniref:glycosyltransferase n=1 Tax=Plantactinospora sp. CA-290183 TaxID=3240006 RepID=UPI003D8D7784